jgi:2-haloacid dehalogenase
VFDVYGTLLDVASVEDACRGVVPDPAGFVELWRHKQLEYTWLRSLMGRYEDLGVITADVLGQVADHRKVQLDEQARERLLHAWVELRPYPEVPDALARLSGLTLAVLSNGSPRMLEDGLRAAGIRDRFAHVLSVDAVATYKPAPVVYELAERALGLDPGQILFVSANGWDAAGAASFGLRVAWVNRSGDAADRLGAYPTLEVGGLDELAVRVAS